MTFPLLGLVLAAGFNTWVFVAVMALAFVNWLFRMIGGVQQRPVAGGPPRQPPRPARRGPGDARLQNEIDAFLRQVTGKARREETPIEIVPEEERRPRQADRPRQRRPRHPSRLQPEVVGRHTPPGLDIAAREAPGSEHLGEDVRTHHLERDVLEHLEDYMDDRVDEGVAEHLGAPSEARRTTAVHLPRAAPGQAHKLVSLLRDPAGVRQAILLNEILSPPKGLRTRQGNS